MFSKRAAWAAQTIDDEPKKRAPKGPLDLALRVDWAREFGRPGPLEVEIGAGMGGFALGYAAARPEVNLVALEIRQKLAREIEEKRVKRGLPNLRVLGTDGKSVLPRMFAPRSVDTFHIQFPDPWWKRRHHGRRLVEDEFSVLLYNLLRVGGRLEVRTDVKERGEEMIEALEQAGFVNVHGPRALAPYDPATSVPSTRERGYLERGQPVFRYALTRTEAPPLRPPPIRPSRVSTGQRRK